VKFGAVGYEVYRGTVRWRKLDIRLLAEGASQLS
jgi:hypothetical protein